MSEKLTTHHKCYYNYYNNYVSGGMKNLRGLSLPTTTWSPTHID